MSPKVMIIYAGRKVTGPAKGIFQFLDHIENSIFAFHLYAFRPNGRLPIAFIKEAQKNYIPVKFFDQVGKSYFSLIRQLIKEVQTEKISIIQTHGFKPTFLGFFARYFCNVKWICFMHGTTSENFKVKIYNLIDNIVQRYSDRTVIVSESQRDKIIGGHNHKRIRVLHNAVDIKQPMAITTNNRRPVRDILNLPPGTKLMVVIGRLSPEKGVDIFIEAFSILARKKPSVHAIIVGDGQERKKLEIQASKTKIADRIHFVGHSNTPGDYVIEADLVVVPSRSEGIPNVVLEAMAFAKPVVATSVGGIPEIIEDGMSGLLVPPLRPDMLAKAILEILDDFELYRKISIGAKKRVEHAFEVKERVKTLLAIYKEVLSTI